MDNLGQSETEYTVLTRAFLMLHPLDTVLETTITFEICSADATLRCSW